jgi:pimeloyl-ACP methyl ester carboxylesterase
MYWAGSKAKFWAISWYGSETQELFGIFTLPATRNYHVNVVNALNTAKPLADYLNTVVKGDITVMAHSLGNMLASSAIGEHGAMVNNYYMVDAAVASEAYGPMDLRSEMDHPEWVPYDPRLYASEWYRLFLNDSPVDNRAKLTWRNKFLNRGTANFYNFYSEGEEVLDKLTKSNGNPSIINFGYGVWEKEGRYAWALQELLKGRLPFGFMIGSTYGGWGFNLSDEDHYYKEIQTEGPSVINKERLKPEETIDILSNVPVLRTKPFFLKGNDDAPLFTENGGSTHASDNILRLLSEVIPARTLAAGKNDLVFNAKGNFDMQALYKTHGKWPRDDISWLHNDIKKVAFLYLFGIFNKFTTLGGGLK